MGWNPSPILTSWTRLGIFALFAGVGTEAALVVAKRDDDEGKSKPREIEEVEPVSLDFNLLSRVLDGIRPKAASWSWPTGAELLSALLFFIGLTCLVLAYRREREGRGLS
jgi:hypothetical protein